MKIVNKIELRNFEKKSGYALDLSTLEQLEEVDKEPFSRKGIAWLQGVEKVVSFSCKYAPSEDGWIVSVIDYNDGAYLLQARSAAQRRADRKYKQKRQNPTTITLHLDSDSIAEFERFAKDYPSKAAAFRALLLKK